MENSQDSQLALMTPTVSSLTLFLEPGEHAFFNFMPDTFNFMPDTKVAECTTQGS